MAYLIEPRVLDVLESDRAVVSTRGLRRILIKPGNEVLAEFVSPQQAKSMADYYNRTQAGERRAVVLKYARPGKRPLKSKLAAAAPYRSAV